VSALLTPATRTSICPECEAVHAPGPPWVCTHCQADLRLAGKFVLERLLGGGGEGRTHAGRDVERDEPVAIKALTLAKAGDWKAIELFNRGAQVLMNLSHPGIPRHVAHFDEGRGRARGFYTVLELIEGESLAQALARGVRFSEAGVVAVARGVLEILQYLHGHSPSIIHRDIKPSNLMRRPDGSVVLIDFGLVRDLAEPRGGSTMALGTVGYTPTEQFMGRAVPATDLYALGATLIALLSRRDPADLYDASAGRLVFREYVNVSDGLAEVLERMVAPGLDRRFTSADAVLRALDDVGRVWVAPTAPAEARALAAPASTEVAVPDRPGAVPALSPDELRATIEVAVNTELARTLRMPAIMQFVYMALAGVVVWAVFFTAVSWPWILGGGLAAVLLVRYRVALGPDEALHHGVLGVTRGRPVWVRWQLFESPYYVRLTPFRLVVGPYRVTMADHVEVELTLALVVAALCDKGDGAPVFTAVMKLDLWRSVPSTLREFVCENLNEPLLAGATEALRGRAAPADPGDRADFVAEVSATLARELADRLHQVLRAQAGLELRRVEVLRLGVCEGEASPPATPRAIPGRISIEDD
jgi:hypothetical protein